MGYANTMILIYGVEISKEQYDLLKTDLDEINESLTTIFYRELNDYEKSKHQVQLTPISPYPHDKGLSNDKVFEIDVVVENADSRIDEEDAINDGNKIFFGRVIASRGYGYQDEFNYFVNNMPQEVLSDKRLLEIINKYKISEDPKIIVTQQVW